MLAFIEDNIMDAAVNLNCNPETETISKNVKQVKPGIIILL